MSKEVRISAKIFEDYVELEQLNPDIELTPEEAQEEIKKWLAEHGGRVRLIQSLRRRIRMEKLADKQWNAQRRKQNREPDRQE